MALEAVIFDMDGVLTDTVEYHYRSWMRVCDEYGIPFSRKDNIHLLGLTRQRSLETILGSKSLPEEQMAEILVKKNKYFHELLDDVTTESLLPGVAELLTELHSTDIRVGVASASRNAMFILARLGIEAYFDIILDGTNELRSKPAPDVYLRAAQSLGKQPWRCLAIEDSTAGVQAAISAGMCVIGLGPTKLVGRAHAVLPDLSHTHVEDLQAIYNWWNASLAMEQNRTARQSLYR
jgi:kojibiose phosphorylase